MTSVERHELRYQRRKQQRLAKRIQQSKTFSEVFTFENLYDSYRKCCRGVGWKASTQRFKQFSVVEVTKLHQQLLRGTFKCRGFHEFDIMERGKPRHIQSVHISERVVQRCLCDYYLVPTLSRSFIYDNGASLTNKGVDFALNRMKLHLHQYYREHGTNEGYILQFDFSKYFDSIQHKILYQQLDGVIIDDKLRKLVHQPIDVFGDVGLGLGSQVSQICALQLPSCLDHTCKERLKIKRYGRYMDDGYLIHRDKQYLKRCLEIITQLCASLGIYLNRNKTQITRINNSFVFLKHRFWITLNGKIICKPRKHCSSQYRRKLKKLYIKFLHNELSLFDAQQVLQSILGHLKKSQSYKIRCNLTMYCTSLWGNGFTIKNMRQLNSCRIFFMTRYLDFNKLSLICYGLIFKLFC